MNKVPMTSGDEFDALTKAGKASRYWKAGQRSSVKRAYRRRCRRKAATATVLHMLEH